MVDVSLIALLTLGSVTLYFGSKAHLNKLVKELHQEAGSSDDESDDGELVNQDLTVREALCFPLMASVMLVVLYYISKTQFQTIITLYFVFASGVAVYFASAPLLARLFHRCGIPTTRLLTPLRHISGTLPAQQSFQGRNVLAKICCCFTEGCERIRLPHTVAICVSVVTTFSWLVTGNWVLNNVIGISLCVLIISSVRLPSLKIASVVLWSLFLYDIFWVFYSYKIFDESVMVAVATKSHDNPVSQLEHTLHVSFPFKVAAQLQMPLKLLMPSSLDPKHVYMLGLGDIGIPGILASFFAFRDWHYHRVSPRSYPIASQRLCDLNYFRLSLMGYVTGLSMAVFCAVVYGIAQPALLYIVPCMTLPCMIAAMKREQLGELWNSIDLTKLNYTRVHETEP